MSSSKSKSKKKSSETEGGRPKIESDVRSSSSNDKDEEIKKTETSDSKSEINASQIRDELRKSETEITSENAPLEEDNTSKRSSKKMVKEDSSKEIKSKSKKSESKSKKLLEEEAVEEKQSKTISSKKKESSESVKKESTSRTKKISTSALNRRKNFESYIHKVLKQVHPSVGLTKDAKAEINNLCNIFIENIIFGANILLQKSHNITMTPKEIHSSIRMRFPKGLKKQSVEAGTKAVNKYSSKKKLRKKSGSEKTPKAVLADLIFPVVRIEHAIRALSIGERIGAGSGVYLAAVIEYLVAEILELSGNAALDNRKQRINVRHILIAIRNDEELNVLTKDIVLSGGVLPNIHPSILPSRGNGIKHKK